MTDTLVATIRAEEPLAALAELATARRALEAETAVQVRRARAAGCSWEAIAAVLGVSRQAAHKRYAERRALLRRNSAKSLRKLRDSAGSPPRSER